jgi:DNA-binding NarL/FixJ family response regulator
MLEYLISMLTQEFEVVSAVQDGAAALDAVRCFAPDVMVLDLAMSPLNGLDVVRSLQAGGASTAVVLVTAYTDPELAKAALAAGAKGFVVKSRLAEDLIPAIRNASRKESVPEFDG